MVQIRFALSLIFCLLLVFQGIYAQSVVIEGMVRDSVDLTPLSGAHVILVGVPDGIRQGIVTNHTGAFRFDSLSAGSYELTVQYLGYQTLVRKLQRSDNQRILVPIMLRPHLAHLNPVVVTASRGSEKALQSAVSISVLESAKLERDVVVSPVASLRSIAGLDLAPIGLDRYQVSIRGFNNTFASRTYAMVDYRRTTFPGFRLNAFAGMPLNPHDIDHVEVVRGPGSALYGGGVEQGIIHFITKDPFMHPGTTLSVGGGGHAVGQVSFRQAGAWNQRLGYKITGAYSRGDDWHLDPSSEDDAAQLATVHPSLPGRDYETWKGSLTGLLAYRIRPDVLITLNGGYSRFKQTLLANTGELQYDGLPQAFTQFRLKAGNLFFQAYMNANLSGDEDRYAYRSGAFQPNRSREFDVQIQYLHDVWNARLRLIGGGDVRFYNPRTGSTSHGRNEEVDNHYEGGVYTQAHYRLNNRIDLVAAGRLDYHSVLSTFEVSPRIAFLYKPSPLHTLRGTYNRAFTAPGPGTFFLDTFIRDTGHFAIRARGNTQGWTFDDPGTSLFAPFGQTPTGTRRYPGIGLPLEAVYGPLIKYILTQPTVLAQLPDQVEPVQLEAFLNSIPVAGLVEGRLVLNGRDIQHLSNLDPIGSTITNTLELGYRGFYANSFLLNADLYYTSKNQLLSNARFITPQVFAPTDWIEPLIQQVSNDVTAEELQAFGLTPAQLALYLRQFGDEVLNTTQPIGLVEPDENYDPTGKPESVLSFFNFGRVSMWGFDCSIDWMVRDGIQLRASYSWMNTSRFDEEDLHEPGTGFSMTLNAPRHKGGLGFSLFTRRGGSVDFLAQYTDAFPVEAGVFQGTVDAYLTMDLSMGYDLSVWIPGLRVDTTVQNLLNRKYRAFIGAPQIGRLALARLTYSL